VADGLSLVADLSFLYLVPVVEGAVVANWRGGGDEADSVPPAEEDQVGTLSEAQEAGNCVLPEHTEVVENQAGARCSGLVAFHVRFDHKHRVVGSYSNCVHQLELEEAAVLVFPVCQTHAMLRKSGGCREVPGKKHKQR
jgi:hypothetical protein